MSVGVGGGWGGGGGGWGVVGGGGARGGKVWRFLWWGSFVDGGGGPCCFDRSFGVVKSGLLSVLPPFPLGDLCSFFFGGTVGVRGKFGWVFWVCWPKRWGGFLPLVGQVGGGGFGLGAWCDAPSFVGVVLLGVGGKRFGFGLVWRVDFWLVGDHPGGTPLWGKFKRGVAVGGVFCWLCICGWLFLLWGLWGGAGGLCLCGLGVVRRWSFLGGGGVVPCGCCGCVFYCGVGGGAGFFHCGVT